MIINWLKAHWFRLVVVTALLVVAGSAAYYYIGFLPQQNKEKLVRQAQDDIFNKNLDCQKYDQKIADAEDGFLRMKFHSGVFYSSKQNSCLYAGLDWDEKIKVKDALTGQEIFSEELKDMKSGTTGQEVKALVDQYK